jgi:hypothetical protein
LELGKEIVDGERRVETASLSYEFDGPDLIAGLEGVAADV